MAGETSGIAEPSPQNASIKPINTEPAQGAGRSVDGRPGNTLGRRIVRAAGIGAFGVGMALGTVGSASGAETQTPTPTKPPATGTPTPDARATQLASLQATVTEGEKSARDATATKVAEAKLDEEIAKLAAKATALSSPTVTPPPTGTPSPTPTYTPSATPTSSPTPDVPATTTKVAQIDEAVAKELADRRDAKATRDEAARIAAEAQKTAEEAARKAAAPPPEPGVIEGATETVSNLPPAAKVAGAAGLGGIGLGIGALIRRLRNRGRGGGGATGPVDLS